MVSNFRKRKDIANISNALLPHKNILRFSTTNGLSISCG